MGLTGLTETLRKTLKRHALIPAESRVVVAVSGGADSLALLHALRFHVGLIPEQLHVATLDHGLRGQAGAEDAEFVRQIAESWGLPVTVGQAGLDPDLPGIEARARQARYRFLAQTAREVGADRIAVAHHVDDQAETVLLHLIRGGGIRGLAGLAYSTPLSAEFDAVALTESPLYVIRPLLDVTRAEIEAYCAEHGLEYRHDATNDEPNTLRNRLRLETIPHLHELNPRISPALHRLARIAADEDDFITQEVNRLIDTQTEIEFAPDAKTVLRVSLNLAVFRGLHPALQRRLVLHLTEILIKDANYPAGFDQIQAAVDLMQKAQVGAVALLPGGVQVRAGYDRLYIERVDAPDNFDNVPYLLTPKSEFFVNIPGEIITSEGWSLRVKVLGDISPETVKTDETINPENGVSLILRVPAGAKIVLRTRKPGDRIAPRGMKGHTRRLKDWLIDRKIPQMLRDHLPLLVIRDEIAAILIESQWQVTELYYHGYNFSTFPGIYINVTVAKT